MSTFIIIKMYCKRRLKIQMYPASLHRARGAPSTRPRRFGNPTALPQQTTYISDYSALLNMLYKRQAAALSLFMFKQTAASWLSLRWHSAPTVRTQRC